MYDEIYTKIRPIFPEILSQTVEQLPYLTMIKINSNIQSVIHGPKICLW